MGVAKTEKPPETVTVYDVISDRDGELVSGGHVTKKAAEAERDRLRDEHAAAYAQPLVASIGPDGSAHLQEPLPRRTYSVRKREVPKAVHEQPPPPEHVEAAP